MLGFGLDELAGKFKTSAKSELEPPKIDGLSANDQNNVIDHQQNQPSQQQQQLNPESYQSQQQLQKQPSAMDQQ